MTKMDKLVRPKFRKGQLFSVSIAWSGTPPSVDRIIGVYEDVGNAVNVSNDAQVHVTQAMLATPGIVAADGRVFVAADDAGEFSVFVDEASARRHVAVTGGRMKSFVLNAAPAAVTASGIQAAERAAIAAGQVPGKAFAGTGTEGSKAALAAIMDALGRPLAAAKSMWR
jgi:hypothetical protein